MSQTHSSKRGTGPGPALVFTALFLLLQFMGPGKMMRDPGTYWHTVVGEQILREGSFPRHDTFTFSRAGEPWIAQQWLGELAMAFVHRLAGLDGLLLAANASIAALFAWLSARLQRTGLPWPAAILLLMLVFAASSYHFMPRPHLATIILMAAMFAILCDAESGRTTSRRLWWLVPLFVLWVNTHGGALGGLASLFIVCMAWLLRPKKRWRVAGDPHDVAAPWMLAGVVGLCLAAMLVNPYVAALPRVWLALMGSDLLPKVVIEHAPPSAFSPEWLMISLLGAFYVIVLASAVRARRGVRATWLLPIVWLALAYSRVRHGPLFAVCAAIGLIDMLPHAGLIAGKLQPAQLVEAPPSRRNWFTRAATALPLLLVLFALTLQTAGIRAPLIGAGRCAPDPAYWPTAASRALAAHFKLHPTENRVFNDMRFGGYLIYQVPQARLYIDDRCELHRDAGLRRYLEVHAHPERFEGLAAYDGVDVALVETRSPLAAHLRDSAGWRLLHGDKTASLFQRVVQTAEARR